MTGALPVLRGKKHLYLWRQRSTKRNPSFPQFIILSLYLFVLSHFLKTFHSSSNLVLKCSGLTVSLSLHFLMKALMTLIKVLIKLGLNKCVPFSVVNLSFLSPVFRAPVREPGRIKGERIFPPLQLETVTKRLSFSTYLEKYWLN